MNQPLYQIIYISSATELLSDDSLRALLAASQSRNAKREVTGLMLYAEGNIIQIIEGPQFEVESLFAKISKDPRHAGLMKLSQKEIEKREFPEYKMGFQRYNKYLINEYIDGFCDLVERRNLEVINFEGLSRHVCIFLKTFARSTRIISA